MKKIEFVVEGMHCGSCGKLIKLALESVKGFVDASVSVKSGKVSVTFDDSLTGVKMLKEVIEKEGFEVRN